MDRRLQEGIIGFLLFVVGKENQTADFICKWGNSLMCKTVVRFALPFFFSSSSFFFVFFFFCFLAWHTCHCDYNNIDVSFILKKKRECSVMCLISQRYVHMRVTSQEEVCRELEWWPVIRVWRLYVVSTFRSTPRVCCASWIHDQIKHTTWMTDSTEQSQSQSSITPPPMSTATSVNRIAPRCQVEARDVVCIVDGVHLTATAKALHPVGDDNCGSGLRRFANCGSGFRRFGGCRWVGWPVARQCRPRPELQPDIAELPGWHWWWCDWRPVILCGDYCVPDLCHHVPETCSVPVVLNSPS